MSEHDPVDPGPIPTPSRARTSAEALLVNAAGQVDVKAFDLPGLERFVVEGLGEKKFRARQLYKWLWQRNAQSFDEMTDLSKDLRVALNEHAYIHRLDPELVLRSEDGTIKYLWKLEDGSTIESVLIPDDGRLTLCMSSQVGCAMACSFCLTGDLGLKRHLKPSEIAGQPLQIQRDLIAELGDAAPRITNLVLMGMGEPLHNLDNLTTALTNCLHDEGLNYSHRRITVSTVGLVPRIGELAQRLPVNLAVSLNATTEEQRRQIMPVTRKYSLEQLMDACREFPLQRTKRITFEYVMFAGFNDSLEDAARLLKLLRGIKAKVNLIPYNENPDRDLRRPSDEVVRAFQNYLVTRNMNCTVRTTRGIDISAACGQLGKAKQQIVEKGWSAEFR